VEVAANDLTPPGREVGLEHCVPAGGDCRKIEQNTAEGRIALEERREQKSAAAPDVDHGRDG
jgi:hypothetical protein